MKRLLFLLIPLGLVSCDPPGKPTLADKWKSPADVTGFTQLYAQNCIACHGDGKSIAGSITLKNPLYLATVPEEKLRDVIANGVPGHRTHKTPGTPDTREDSVRACVHTRRRE